MEKEELIHLILQQMEEKGDFPLLSDSVSIILNTLRDAENTSMDTIVSHVMSDYALSQKVMRLANSAMYHSMGGEVTSITRAIMILGLDAIIYLALGLKLLDGFDAALGKNAGTRKVLAQATLTSNVTRLLASRSAIKDGEECVLLSLFAFLGQLVLMLYVPEVWDRCCKLAENDMSRLDPVLRAHYATDTREIAQALAKHWGFPEQIWRNIGPVRAAASAELNQHQRSQALVNVGAELAIALTSEVDDSAINHLMAQHVELLGIDAKDIQSVVDYVKNSELLQEVLEAGQGASESPQEILEKAIEEATLLRAQSAKPSEILSLVVEAAHRAMAFRRTVFFSPDLAQQKYVARVGLGAGVDRWIKNVSFGMDFAPDAFHLSLFRNIPVKLDSITATNSRVPEWYRLVSPDARACLTVPLVVDGKPKGLMVGEWHEDAPSIEGKDLDLLLKLKNIFLAALVSVV